MPHYSAVSIFKNAVTGNRHWHKAWCDPQPGTSCDRFIIDAEDHRDGWVSSTTYSPALDSNIVLAFVKNMKPLRGAN